MTANSSDGRIVDNVFVPAPTTALLVPIDQRDPIRCDADVSGGPPST